MNKKILLVAGDPLSINTEIIFKAWKSLSKKIKKNVILIGNFNLINKQFKVLKYKIPTVKLNDLGDKNYYNKLKIIDVPLKFTNPFKIPLKTSSEYIIKSLTLAHNLAVRQDIQGFANCPIDKIHLKKTKKVGVTEFLASKCKVPKNSEVMLIHNKNFSVVPLTTHIRIKNVAKTLNQKFIKNKVLSLNKNFKKLFKEKPKIGILGLNPHNSELQKKSEEKQVLIPVIRYLKDNKVNISGPLVSDTLFIDDYKRYDVIVGMYHDQVLTPFKTLYKFDAINITLGLKYIRVSPDHGTAINLIKKNKANSSSLINCIKFLYKLGK